MVRIYEIVGNEIYKFRKSCSKELVFYNDIHQTVQHSALNLSKLNFNNNEK